MTQPPPPGTPPPAGPPPGTPPPGGFPPAGPQGGGFPPQGYPQQGGYPQQPPQGSYPQPPAGGYPAPPAPGAMPPPPPGGPGYYGQAPAGVGPYNVGDGVSWAWNKFTKHPAELIVPALIYGAVAAVLGGILYVVMIASMVASVDSSSYTYDEYGYSSTEVSPMMSAGFIVGMILFYLVLLLIASAFLSSYTGGVLDIANGQPVSIGSFLKPRRFGAFLGLTLLIGLLTGIGTVLCIIPGLAVALFAMFATIALLDRNLGVVDALKFSFDVVKNNIGDALVAYLVIVGITLVGELLCGIGLIVAFPVAHLFQVYAYRKLSGGQVAPAIP